MALSKKVAIGIDLGTTSSAVGVWRNGQVEIIPNDRGQRTTPSYIAFNDAGRLIGDDAKSQVGSNPTNTVWSFKSLLGRFFDDPEVQEGIPHWPFKVVNIGGKPIVEMVVNGGIKRFTPEELTCILLMYLKHKAEEYLCQGVTDAVITIPACFDSYQVAATKKAAELAGLNVLKLLSDPTAAALTYIEQAGTSGVDDEERRNLLVVNVGGATTGMSVVSVKGGFVKVRATDGNTNLGGEHFDNKMVAEVSRICRDLTKKDISADPGALRRLRTECEGAKRKLSMDTVGPPVIVFAHPDTQKEIYTGIPRPRFLQLCQGLFREAVLGPVEDVLRGAQMEKSGIHEILLVGGSSRIPKIQELLQEHFNGKELNKTLDPDEAPAHGAALLAAILTGSDNPQIDLTLLEDVTPFSLAVQTGEAAATAMIPRNSPIPAKQTYTFTTVYDNQSAVLITVVEGDTGKYSTVLGAFFLSGIPPAPAGAPKIDITFEVDGTGALTVTAVEKSTGQEKRITIEPGNGKLLIKEQITAQLVAEAKAKKIQDYQKAYAAVRSSYEAVGKLFYSARETKDFVDKKMKELEEEGKRNESKLTPQEFPIVVVPISSTNRTSGGVCQLGGPQSKRRRKQ